MMCVWIFLLQFSGLIFFESYSLSFHFLRCILNHNLCSFLTLATHHHYHFRWNLAMQILMASPILWLSLDQEKTVSLALSTLCRARKMSLDVPQVDPADEVGRWQPKAPKRWILSRMPEQCRFSTWTKMSAIPHPPLKQSDIHLIIGYSRHYGSENWTSWVRTRTICAE